MITPRRSRFQLLSLLALSACFGCQPGYIKASDLESKGQGPAACAKTCEDLGMRMAALVLVGDTLPGCVCQPLNVQAAPAPKPEPPASPSAPVPPSSPAPSSTPPPSGAPAPGAPPAQSSAPTADGVSEGAAAATTGYVVIAAAVAAQQTQQDRQRQSSTPLSSF